MELKDSMLVTMNESFALVDDNILRYQDKLCVPDVDDLRTNINVEAHGSRFSLHPEHLKPGGLTKIIEVLTWKLKAINMDFMDGLPKIMRKIDSIWVIMDRMIKSGQFILVKSTYIAEDYAKLYIDEIV
ncbi:uncharacterized protein [Solanum lycopersicum]|uniref:uncharacterized protein n=1 Tax=Solanum lycopersicum TaxID=4081 RepID=UPI003747ADE7